MATLFVVAGLQLAAAAWRWKLADRRGAVALTAIAVLLVVQAVAGRLMGG